MSELTIEMFRVEILRQVGYIQLSPATWQAPSGLQHQCWTNKDLDELAVFALENAVMPSEPSQNGKTEEIVKLDAQLEQATLILSIWQAVKTAEDDATEKRKVVNAQ